VNQFRVATSGCGLSFVDFDRRPGSLARNPWIAETPPATTTVGIVRAGAETDDWKSSIGTC